MRALSLFCFITLSIGNLRAQTVEVSRSKIKTLITDWNTAHNDRDCAKLRNLYAPEVLFYCKKMSRQKCIEKKSELFKMYSNFDQNIVSNDLILTAYSTGKIKCEFTKEVRANKKVNPYPSYLVLVKKENIYLIVCESDKITDHNLKYTLELGTPLQIVNVEETQQPESLAGQDGDTFSSLLLKFAFIIAFVIVIGITVKSFSGRAKASTTLPVTNRAENRIEGPVYHSVTSEHSQLRSTITNKDDDVDKRDRVLTSAQIGYEFEQYAVKKFRKNDYLTLEEWRGDKMVKHVVVDEEEEIIYAKSTQYPDLQYQFKLRFDDPPVVFAVECKFRSKIQRHIKLATIDKMNRYREFQFEKKMKVYLLLGLGGSPSAPKELFLIPLDAIDTKDEIVSYTKFLEKYKKGVDAKFFFDSKTWMLS